MLQTATALGARDLRRLMRSLEVGIAQVFTYSYLSLGRATDSLDPSELREFLVALAEKEGGYGVAIDVLHMRLHSDHAEQEGTERQTLPELVDCGQNLLLRCDFSGTDRMDYELAELVRWCMRGVAGERAARELCRNFREALRDYRTSAYLFDSLAVALFETQPMAALDELLGDDSELSALVEFRISRTAPLRAVEDDVLLRWAASDDAKFARLAAAIPLFDKPDDESGNRWSSKFLRLLDAAPDKGSFLNIISRHLHPTSWSGSLAAILEDRRRLVEQLSQHDNDAISLWARENVKLLDERIQHELLHEHRNDETFE